MLATIAVIGGILGIWLTQNYPSMTWPLAIAGVIAIIVVYFMIMGNPANARKTAWLYSLVQGAFLGVPAVNIGTRQKGRESGSNVINVDYDSQEILDAVRTQMSNGKYPSEHIYGDGHSGKRIAEILASCDVSLQKRMGY